ncbi:conserved Plasmodium protein, unknown function [Plasmodium berghei]|uniref:Uncharacterized protein n=2 Tax=Plasmodium berghei TaxID=5821 RepID=A0A509ANS2_PLABA|nr:conserved protein, unknown function [Plasmodium berghei ANKA]CXI60405.1 conserved Plasmodium protein, unknown function [Plasmodium berghei]SCM23561.1 conserved Plasmodium protein, unknown function [Plasmodium berghei]SCN26659.1 conserved Plasmodium protein, unknown function [Plasmodium berghei]SCO60926.1 conserved Plasmodium protein, unknown function [Plasmodium berghei]SCO62968.1 conserved Plasmodium protein, unknown function [Plasmodium berghei]|eukprot:XP_034422275.1 conserved protein, unknown function [Plasmodium berghei ANKA]
MSINRINKIILCSKVELKSIERMEFYTTIGNDVVKDFCEFFFPTLKYNNFHVIYTFNTVQDHEKIILWPRNKDIYTINLNLYKYSHQLYNRILFLDSKFSESQS